MPLLRWKPCRLSALLCSGCLLCVFGQACWRNPKGKRAELVPLPLEISFILFSALLFSHVYREEDKWITRLMVENI